MPGKSQSHTDAVLNVLRGTDLTGVAPYVGLFSVAPADDNSAGTELVGDGYGRQAITFGAPVTDAGNVRKVANTNTSSGPRSRTGRRRWRSASSLLWRAPSCTGTRCRHPRPFSRTTMASLGSARSW